VPDTFLQCFFFRNRLWTGSDHLANGRGPHFITTGLASSTCASYSGGFWIHTSVLKFCVILLGPSSKCRNSALKCVAVASFYTDFYCHIVLKFDATQHWQFIVKQQRISFAEKKVCGTCHNLPSLHDGVNNIFRTL
jgi:hypothetical protein